MLGEIKRIKDSLVTVFDDDILLYNPYTLATCILLNYKIKLNVNSIFDSKFESHLVKYFNNQNIMLESFFNDTEVNQALAKHFSNQFKYQRKLTISDAFSYSCNMKCEYCFEYKFSEKNKKLKGTKRINYIRNLINIYENKVDLIDFIFFGGEPLLNLNYIENMCRFLTYTYKTKKYVYLLQPMEH